MSTTTTRTLQDRMAGISRMIRALDRNPEEWEPADLARLSTLKNQLAGVQLAAVVSMRDSGITDTEIAEALNITRQAVSKRWPGGGRYVGAAGRYRQQRGDPNEPAIPTA